MRATGRGLAFRGLYRSRRKSVLLGVCAGLAERFDVSPWGVRLLFVALQLTVAPWMILLYIGLGLALKREPMLQAFDRWHDDIRLRIRAMQ